MTKYEEKILNIINSSYDHMTSEEVFFALKKEEKKVVLATVYNNLKKLTDDGKIIKLSLSGQPERYDKKTRHDHLICTKCFKISDFTFTNLTEKIEGELGQIISGYDLRINYICPDCRKETK